jgi:FkbM family methyltransferase
MKFLDIIKCGAFKYLPRKINNLLKKVGLKISEASLTFQDLSVDLCIDVGANIGQYGKKVFGSGYKGAIVSFEAQPDAYSKLLNESKFYSNWIVAPICALGDSKCVIDFNISSNSFSSSALLMKRAHVEAAPDSFLSKIIKVQQYRFSDIIDNLVNLESFKNIYLKLDTQGYEKNILMGISEAHFSRLSYIELELSLVELYEGQELFFYYFNLLYSKGFYLIHLEKEFTNKTTLEILQLNGVFKKKV